MASSTKNAPKAYLITGGTGAGKTTYARRLEDEIGAIRFSIDDWMTALFWMDSSDPISYDWAMERINRAEQQIWDMALQLFKQNLSVIFDLGFTKEAHRQKFASLLQNQEIAVSLHMVDVDKNLRWSRVQQRNQTQDETFAMEVSSEMFEFMETIWEAPSQAEMQALHGVKIQ